MWRNENINVAKNENNGNGGNDEWQRGGITGENNWQRGETAAKSNGNGVAIMLASVWRNGGNGKNDSA